MSNEVKSKEKVNLDPKYIIKLTVTLFVTCVIVAGLLGATNMVTEEKIAAINLEKTQEAISAVLPGGYDEELTSFDDQGGRPAFRRIGLHHHAGTGDR